MPPSLRVKFGARLRTLRKARAWTQEQLAERSRLSTEYISGIENGRRDPSLSSLRKIARGFGMALSELMKGL